MAILALGGCDPAKPAAPATTPATTASVSTVPAATVPSAGPGSRPTDEFPTPSVLLDRYNEFNSQTPPNLPEIVKLYHPENDLQQRWVGWLVNSAKFYDLDKAMQDHFGEPWVVPLGGPLPPDAKPTPAHLVLLSDARAQAEFTNAAGDTKSLQLVRVGHNWMISGFTLEYGMSPEASEKLVEKLLKSKPDAAWVPAFVARIRAGEFKTAADARAVRQAERAQAPPPATQGG